MTQNGLKWFQKPVILGYVCSILKNKSQIYLVIIMTIRFEAFV